MTGVLLVVLGAAAFSGKAILVKLGFRLSADPPTLRMALPLPLFLAMAMAAWAARRHWRQRPLAHHRAGGQRCRCADGVALESGLNADRSCRAGFSPLLFSGNGVAA